MKTKTLSPFRCTKSEQKFEFIIQKKSGVVYLKKKNVCLYCDVYGGYPT